MTDLYEAGDINQTGGGRDDDVDDVEDMEDVDDELDDDLDGSDDELASATNAPSSMGAPRWRC